jgi:hypothetical protein
VVAECEMSEAAWKAVASKIMRAIGTPRSHLVMHKQAYMMANLVQELRNEEQFMADFANAVVLGQASLNDFSLGGAFVHSWGFWVCR